MNTSHQSVPLTSLTAFEQTLAFIQSIQRKRKDADETSMESESEVPIPSVIFTNTTTTNATTTMSQRPRGRIPGVGNFGIAETMHMLRQIKDVLPIGSDQWKEVADRHAAVYPFRSKEAIQRKYNSLQRKAIPTGDPDCPEEVRLAKQVKHLIGDKACIGDAEEEFDLEDVQFGECGGNPAPFTANDNTDAPNVENVSTVTNTPSRSKRRYVTKEEKKKSFFRCTSSTCCNNNKQEKNKEKRTEREKSDAEKKKKEKKREGDAKKKGDSVERTLETDK